MKTSAEITIYEERERESGREKEGGRETDRQTDRRTEMTEVARDEKTACKD